MGDNTETDVRIEPPNIVIEMPMGLEGLSATFQIPIEEVLSVNTENVEIVNSDERYIYLKTPDGEEKVDVQKLLEENR